MARFGVTNIYLMWLQTAKMYQKSSTNIRLISDKTKVVINRTVLLNDRMHLVRLCGMRVYGLVYDSIHQVKSHPYKYEINTSYGKSIKIETEYDVNFILGAPEYAVSFYYKYGGHVVSISHWQDLSPRYIQLIYSWNQREQYPVTLNLPDDLFEAFRMIIKTILSLDIPARIIAPLLK